MDLISILIPVRNAELYIKECLNSVLEQTYEHWQCIIVNDLCTDNTIEIVHKFLIKDTRFQLVINNGSGIIDANKTGLNKCTGKFITRMDADDIMPKNRLELMHYKIIFSEIKTIVCGNVKYFGDFLGEGILFYENWLNGTITNQLFYENIWRECVIPSPCWMARTADVISYKLFDSPMYPEDYFMAFTAIENQFKIIGISDVCHYWRQHNTRASASTNNYSTEKFTEMKLHFYLKKYKPGNVTIIGAGKKAYYLITLLEQKNIHWELYDYRENKINQVVFGNKIRNIGTLPYSNTPVISMLSSIDNHALLYNLLNSKNITYLKFA